MRGATVGVFDGVDDETFQSTRPMRGATRISDSERCADDVSIHAPHAGRDPYCARRSARPCVSIHAPHAGRDHSRFERQVQAEVSIHAPHAGRDYGAI